MSSRSFGGGGPLPMVMACIVALIVAADVARAGVLIDDFSAAQAPWPIAQSSVGSTNVIETGLAGVIGGRRDSTIEATSLLLPGIDNITAAIAPAVGLLDFSSSAGADGRLDLFYEGAGGDLGADLSGEVVFEIELTLFDFASLIGMPVEVTLDDGAGVASAGALVSGSGAQTVQIAMAGFAGLDLSSINSIRVDFDPGQSADFRVREIRTAVPGPGALASLLLAGAAGGRRRRRRRD